MHGEEMALVWGDIAYILLNLSSIPHVTDKFNVNTISDIISFCTRCSPHTHTHGWKYIRNMRRTRRERRRFCLMTFYTHSIPSHPIPVFAYIASTLDIRAHCLCIFHKNVCASASMSMWLAFVRRRRANLIYPRKKLRVNILSWVSSRSACLYFRRYN